MQKATRISDGSIADFINCDADSVFCKRDSRFPIPNSSWTDCKALDVYQVRAN